MASFDDRRTQRKCQPSFVMKLINRHVQKSGIETVKHFQTYFQTQSLSIEVALHGEVVILYQKKK